MSKRAAIEGGSPVRESFLEFSRPAITEAEIEAVTETLRSGWLTMGPRVLEFEDCFRERVGSSEAVAVSSCTAGLHLTLVALGVAKGDEVITSPFTFTSTANVIVHQGGRPVFADIQRDTFNIDPDEVKKHLTDGTKVILPVHFAGHPCDMDELLSVAESCGIFVLEDAAHAFGASYDGRPVGSIGDATVFSFYATKNITTCEGGLVATDNSELADEIRSLRLHGIDRDAWKRHTAAGDWYYEVHAAGFKCNMTDVQAAMGVAQLARADELLERRREIAKRMTDALSCLSQVTLPVERKDVVHAWHLYPIILDTGQLRIDRGQFIEALRAENIGSGVHFIPLHLQPFYQKYYGYKRGDFPNAENVCERIVSLPLYPSMSESDVDDVIDAVAKIAEYYGR